jgi:hypothetical protein
VPLGGEYIDIRDSIFTYYIEVGLELPWPRSLLALSSDNIKSTVNYLLANETHCMPLLQEKQTALDLDTAYLAAQECGSRHSWLLSDRTDPGGPKGEDETSPQ